MHGENGIPVTPEWRPEPKPWDAKNCCPLDCPKVCESAQHAVFMHGEAHIFRGTE